MINAKAQNVSQIQLYLQQEMMIYWCTTWNNIHSLHSYMCSSWPCMNSMMIFHSTTRFLNSKDFFTNSWKRSCCDKILVPPIEVCTNVLLFFFFERPFGPNFAKIFWIHMLEPNSSNFKTCGYCFDTNFQIPDLSSPFPKLCQVPVHITHSPGLKIV